MKVARDESSPSTNHRRALHRISPARPSKRYSGIREGPNLSGSEEINVMASESSRPSNLSDKFLDNAALAHRLR